jgi:hypothetical protein
VLRGYTRVREAVGAVSGRKTQSWWVGLCWGGLRNTRRRFVTSGAQGSAGVLKKRPLGSFHFQAAQCAATPAGVTHPLAALKGIDA